MRKKRIIIIILTILVFLSASMLGVSAVYRVNDVEFKISLVSEETKAEAETLQLALKKLYEADNILFVSDTKAKTEFEKYPHFLLRSFKKAYPNRLILTAEENPEVYAVEKGEDEGYYILGADGTVLRFRESAVNRVDGKNNVLITGLSLLGNKGEILTGKYFSYTLSLCKKLDELTGGIRTNVKSVAVKNTTTGESGVPLDEKDVVLEIQFSEGVVALVYNPVEDAVDKAERLYSFYADMSTGDRTCGKIYVPNKGTVYYER